VVGWSGRRPGVHSPLPRSAVAVTIDSGQTWIVHDNHRPVATITYFRPLKSAGHDGDPQAGPGEVAAYRLAWADLETRALDEQASIALIGETQEGYERG